MSSSEPLCPSCSNGVSCCDCKPREWYLTVHAGLVDKVFNTKPLYEDECGIHVIEISAYRKAIEALKEIYADGSYTDIAAEISTKALKELGEL